MPRASSHPPALGPATYPLIFRLAAVLQGSRHHPHPPLRGYLHPLFTVNLLDLPRHAQPYDPGTEEERNGA